MHFRLFEKNDLTLLQRNKSWDDTKTKKNKKQRKTQNGNPTDNKPNTY